MKISNSLGMVVAVMILTSLYFFNSRVHAQEQLEILTCECPPLSYENNHRVEGPGADLVRHIQKKLNTHEQISIFPWARAYRTTEEVANTVLFSTAKTPQREDLFKWVGPMAEKKYYFFARMGSKIEINSIEDAKKYTVGVHLESNNHRFLLAQGFETLQPVVLEEQNLMKLYYGRIDLWYVDSATPMSLTALHFMKGAVEKKYFVQNIKLYYAFNKATPDRVVNNWQQALDNIRQQGTMLEVFKKHNLENLYPIQY